MNVVFVHNGHQISVERNVSEMRLLIDGKCTDQVKGLIKKDNDISLKGTTDSGDDVRVEFHAGGLKNIFNQVILYYNGEVIDNKNIL